MKAWWKSGDPLVWLTAAAVSTSVLVVFGLLILIAVRGLGHFWPTAVMEATYTQPDGQNQRLIGEIRDQETIPTARLHNLDYEINTEQVTRYLIKTGNRKLLGMDFRWVLGPQLQDRHYPPGIVVIEQREWGNSYGYLQAIAQAGQVITQDATAVVDELHQRLQRALEIREQIRQIEKHEISKINYSLEKLRLDQRRLELDDALDATKQAEIAQQKADLEAEYQQLGQQLAHWQQEINRDSLTIEIMDGRLVEIPLANVVRFYYPNQMSLLEKISYYAVKVREFLFDEPREANTEGGVFPAIFGTIMMVFIMSFIVTPFGVVAAVYLREYAKQGWLTRTIRIAVNNLAGVPSIVYGVFGLGFFVYFVGANIDKWFFPEALPAPTFGTPGLLWASLTLAILTVPVVIVSTEEGLTRIPRAIREGSLALGATRAETLWRVVIPMASPAIMTGLILAIARAAGEVAPLMIVGVVKLAPSLVVDANFPFLHLERKFMHLGFHIYDVGFQSPNVEAARPLVYATAFLLVTVIIVLNLTAIWIRNRLREKYKALETL
jgi:phosphate transport system permease protein